MWYHVHAIEPDGTVLCWDKHLGQFGWYKCISPEKDMPVKGHAVFENTRMRTSPNEKKIPEVDNSRKPV